ncbi:MAG: hypothetical protein WCT77_11070 [Bacteroidota bacterium]
MTSKILLKLLLVLVFLSGCTIVTRQDIPEQKTQLEIREFQTREFDTNDTKLIMKAVLNVLQDDGFVVKNAVVDLGLLTATKEIDLRNSTAANRNEDFWTTFFRVAARGSSSKSNTETTYQKVKVVEVSVNVSELGKRSKVRANFQAKVLDNKGNVLEVYPVDDAKFYQDFFAKVDKGIFLQKQGF